MIVQTTAKMYPAVRSLSVPRCRTHLKRSARGMQAKSKTMTIISIANDASIVAFWTFVSYTSAMFMRADYLPSSRSLLTRGVGCSNSRMILRCHYCPSCCWSLLLFLVPSLKGNTWYMNRNLCNTVRSFNLSMQKNETRASKSRCSWWDSPSYNFKKKPSNPVA